MIEIFWETSGERTSGISNGNTGWISSAIHGRFISKNLWRTFLRHPWSNFVRYPWKQVSKRSAWRKISTGISWEHRKNAEGIYGFWMKSLRNLRRNSWQKFFKIFWKIFQRKRWRNFWKKKSIASLEAKPLYKFLVQQFWNNFCKIFLNQETLVPPGSIPLELNFLTKFPNESSIY